MKKSLFVLLILALVMVACTTSTEPTTPSDVDTPQEGGLPDLGGRELTIGSDPIPPMTYIEDDGSLTGFEPDLLDEICKLVNCTVDWKIVAWDGIFAALAAGEYDLVVGGVVYTEDRDAIVDFTDPYYLTGGAVAVRADETEIQTPDDLLNPGVITAVQTGGIDEIMAIDFGIPDDQLKHYATIDLQFLALANGDVDAALNTVEVTGEFVNAIHEGEMKILSDENGIILMTEDTIHIVMSEEDSDIREAFDAAIQQLIQDGTVANLLNKWNILESIPE